MNCACVKVRYVQMLVGLSCAYVFLYDVFEVRNLELLGLFCAWPCMCIKGGYTNIKHTLISYLSLLYTYT